MEIKTRAYIPFRLNRDYDKVIISEELTLKGKELIKMQSMPNNFDDFGFKNIERQEYKVKYLDEYHKTFTYSNEYIEICFKKDNIDTSIYIASTFETRIKLKWMNKMYWIQKNDSWKWIIGIVVTIILARYRTMQNTK